MQQHDYSRPRSLREYARLFFTGFGMGAADIVPGVSGGTIAFISGIYQTLLDAIKSFNLDAIRLALKFDFRGLFTHVPVTFLAALGIGILTAIFALSNLLGGALDTTPTFVFAFFGGLVIASIITIGLKIEWNGAALIALLIGAVFAFWLVGLPALSPESVDHSLPTLFLSGSIAIMAMILPGISGSFILLILGQYPFILAAVRERNLAVLLTVAAGCAVGIVLFSRVLSWLLTRHHRVTIAALTGFMLGSLRKIWEEATTIIHPAVSDLSALERTRQATGIGNTEILVISILLALIGFLVVSIIDHMQTGENPVLRYIWRRKASPVAA